jgi:hypothetical protein
MPSQLWQLLVCLDCRPEKIAIVYIMHNNN